MPVEVNLDRVLKALRRKVDAIKDPYKRAHATYVFLELHDLLAES